MDDEKIVSIEERIPKLKQARRKKSNRRLVFYLSVLFLLVVVVVYLQSPLSHVGQVNISGNVHTEADELKGETGITNATNIWQVDLDDVAEKVEGHPQIAKADVARSLPSTIEVNVEERHRVGYVKSDGAFHPILDNGTSLTSEKLSSPSGDAPLIAGFSKQTYLDQMTEELQDLPRSVTQLISEIHWDPTEDNPYQIKLYMNDGYEVQGSIRDFAEKMKAYPSIVAQLDTEDKGIIHLDVGAYLEPYQNTESSEENNDESQG
ncbi:cell division protein FtsQ/DivIB [Thalassobacillus sp. CUG 92003]|uniref:cell division protein FtsQ/DivIB n=1 Tax=Thalassobacillus sp. CUG 92003 TaxID=2736641 RepID=UPI0015E6803D|nr:FtsQ-type POTRA domain-containing protein [Thalassobacillus sp. CUG 92003]